jgi:hypothetical protein
MDVLVSLVAIVLVVGGAFLLFGLITASIAERKGLDGGRWFWLGGMFGPNAAVIAALAEDGETPRPQLTRRVCPWCSVAASPADVSCAACGRSLATRTVTCPACRVLVPPESVCTVCGAKLPEPLRAGVAPDDAHEPNWPDDSRPKRPD